MRRPIRFLLQLFSFFLVLAAVSAVGNRNGTAHAEGADRMYVFNMDFDGTQGNLILVESNGRWGLLDAGHRSANTIQDADGRMISVPESKQYSNQISMRNGKDVARYMVNVLGVTHLDFVVGTHSHMDHIGGVPEIATTPYRDSSGQTRYLVDGNTTYFYKEYQHIADFEDDLVRYSDYSWHNQAYYYQAVKAMQDQGANLVDVSKQQVIHGNPENAYGDYISFTMGNMSFRLYNVHEQTDTGNENVNSIVTVMTNGDYTVVNLSDVNINKGAIDRTSEAIGKDFDSVDVVVAGHHGYAGSNTKIMFDELQPDYVVVSNGSGHDSWLYTSGDLAAAIPYARNLFGTQFYSTALSPYAIVTDLSGNEVYVYNLEYSGELTDAFYKAIKTSHTTGWVSWINTEETLWSWLNNGQPQRDSWRQIDGRWYHFDADGIMETGWVDGGYFCGGDGAMVTGWRQLDGLWYYFSPEGAKVTGGWKQIGRDWYYFDYDGVMQTGWVEDGRYYCRENGVMATGWEQIDGIWTFFEDSGVLFRNGWKNLGGRWYRFDENGAMQTGWVEDGQFYCRPDGVMAQACWEMVDGSWYYFSEDGSKYSGGWKQLGGDWYFFDADGVMQTGWLDADGECYYLKDNGIMARGWLQINGVEYFFYDNGVMARDTIIDGYMVDADGVFVP